MLARSASSSCVIEAARRARRKFSANTRRSFMKPEGNRCPIATTEYTLHACEVGEHSHENELGEAMSRLDDLERLNELRENGTLSYQEFVIEKAKLLEWQGKASTSRWALPRNIGEWRRSRWSLLPSLVLVPLVILGVHEFRTHATATAGTATNSLANEASVSDASDTDFASSGTNSSWTVSTSSDPMTDAVKHVATASFPSDLGRVEVAISCDNEGNSNYEARSFDKDEKPLPMETDIVNFAAGIPFDLRINGGKPMSLRMSQPRYTNVVDFQPGFLPLIQPGMHSLAQAAKLMLQLHLDGGDQTIAIDQGDPVLKTMVKPCANANPTLEDNIATRLMSNVEAPAPRATTATSVTDM